uniref:Uncharacterized protein n=1 Tax=Oryza sativa subsp. japonica TaxID=39947 RepID=Q6Z628_ORYSJ|nr:hypothetical protein [Oryza sativa Japonica Group]
MACGRSDQLIKSEFRMNFAGSRVSLLGEWSPHKAPYGSNPYYGILLAFSMTSDDQVQADSNEAAEVQSILFQRASTSLGSSSESHETATRPCANLAMKHYGPYEILEKIGSVGYKLNVYSVACFIGIGCGGLMPIEILNRRMVIKGNATIVQIQIRWGCQLGDKLQFKRAAADIVTTNAVQSTGVGDKRRKRYKAIRFQVVAPQLHLLLHSPPTAVSPFPQEHIIFPSSATMHRSIPFCNATTAIYTSLLSAHGSSHSRGFLGGVECRSGFWVMWSVHPPTLKPRHRLPPRPHRLILLAIPFLAVGFFLPRSQL